MSNIRVLEVESFLATYVIDEGKVVAIKDGDENELSIIESTIEEKILRKEQEILESQVIHDEEGDNLTWLVENELLGSLGEKVVLSYLQNIFEKVTLVSQNAKKGYDIEVEKESGDLIGYEVKTSLSTMGFHITYNELKVASKKKDDYYLFFLTIYEEEKTVEGYLIKNPLKELDINFGHITKIIETKNVLLIPNKFLIKFQKGFLQKIKKITLKIK